MPKISLLGSGVAGRSINATAQSRKNFYLDIDAGGGDKAKVVAYPTPGLTEWWGAMASPGFDGPVLGLLPVFSGIDALAAVGVVGADAVLKVFRGATTATITQVLDAAITSPVIMACNGAQLLIALSTPEINLYHLGANTFEQFTLPFITGNVDWCVFLDGRFVIPWNQTANPGRFGWSALYDGSNVSSPPAWDALSYATAESSYDRLTRGFAYRGILVLFGTRTTEFWQSTGDLNSPWAPIAGTAGNFGLSANDLHTVQLVGGVLYFVGTLPNGARSVCRLQGYEAVPCSPPDLDYLFRRDHQVEAASSATFRISGHDFYLLNLETASYLYDATSGVWSVWESPGRDISQITCTVNYSGLSGLTPTTLSTEWLADTTWGIASPPVGGFVAVRYDGDTVEGWYSAPSLGTVTLLGDFFDVTADVESNDASTPALTWDSGTTYLIPGTDPLVSVDSLSLNGSSASYTYNLGLRQVRAASPLPNVTCVVQTGSGPAAGTLVLSSGLTYDITAPAIITSVDSVSVAGVSVPFTVTGTWQVRIDSLSGCPATAGITSTVTHEDVPCSYVSGSTWLCSLDFTRALSVICSTHAAVFTQNATDNTVTLNPIPGTVEADAIESTAAANSQQPMVGTALGWIMSIDPESYTEPNLDGLGVALTREIILPHLFDGDDFNRMIVSRFRLDAEGEDVTTCPAMVANFSVSPESGASPLSIDLAYTGTGTPAVYSWVATADTFITVTSAAASPTLVLDSLGADANWTVTLTVTNACGDISTAAKTVLTLGGA